MSCMRRLAFYLIPLLFVGILSGCDVDAIWTSKTGIDINFGTDSNPQAFDIANINASLGTITVSITADKAWIKVAPTVATCKPPEGGRRIQTTIEVNIDRSKITSLGKHEGTITLKAIGVKPVSLKVKALQEELAPVLPPLNIVNPVTTYNNPYLVEFSFSLRDKDDRAVRAEPAQFVVAGYENEYQVGNPQGLLLRRGAARQLWLELVLDYSVLMEEIENAIPEMERAIREVLLPNLNEDVLVSASGFYRATSESSVIVPYTVDKEHVANKIEACRTQLFHGWASGAKVYEALLSSIKRFQEQELSEEDEKYIVLFCNGLDTSSKVSASDVINAAKSAGVHIIVVGFGETMDSADLITLAQNAEGRYISASSLEDLQSSFDRVVEDLDCQYVVRWASLRRDAVAVRPSFTLTLTTQEGSASATYATNKKFVARDWEGDSLQGKLVLIQSETPGNTTVFLRANYVPYDISELRFYVGSAHNYVVSVVDAANDGLLGGWTKSQTTEPDGRQLIILKGNTPIPFASFGAMLRFEFTEVVDEPFTAFDVDNSLYSDGQSFVKP